MRADRRTMLKSAAALVAVPLVGGTAMAAPRMVVFDSRVPESSAFAARMAGARIDLAEAHQTHWVALRGYRGDIGTVEGLTGWSDWIAVRGELEARGLRLASEAPVAAPLSGKAHLFRWSMKSR
jgi:hypothetical protein